MLMNGMKIFMAGAWAMPPLVRAWLAILITTNGILPLWFIHELAAQIALLAVFSGSMIAFAMCAITGFNRYLGLMHGPWIAIVYVNCFTLCQRSDLDPNFKNWLIASLLFSGISLIIDVIDVVKYGREQIKPA